MEKEKLATVAWHLGAEENGIGTGKDLVAVVEDLQDCADEVVAVTTKKMWKKMVIPLMDPVEEVPVVDHVLLMALEEKHRAVEVVPVVVEEVTIPIQRTS